MDAYDKPIYLRSAVLLVVFLLHGSLILVFLRGKLTYRDHPASADFFTTIFFISLQPPRPALPPVEPARTARQRTRDLRKPPPPEAPVSSPDPTVPAENPHAAAAPPIDWSAEAQRSAADIVNRGALGRGTQSPSSARAVAPWDPRRHLLESTDHGLTLQLPLQIPGDLIDHCFASLDLGHDQAGQRQLYQLKCALVKQPARGDLFDFVRKPSEHPK